MSTDHRFAHGLVVLTLLAMSMLSCTTPQRAEETPPAPSSYEQIIPGTSVSFDMIWIPEGNFWIGKTEVTWDEYLLYCDFEETRRSSASATASGVDAIARPSKPLDVQPYDRDWGAGRRPAVGMSRNAARAYCDWLVLLTGIEYRLPTEDQWKLACAGATADTAAAADALDELAWFTNNSDDMTQEVATLRADSHGLHDMLGNLWEYCDNPYDASEPERAVLRGGSWRDDAGTLTATARLGFNDDWVLADPNVPPGVWWVPDGDHLGFRILRHGPAKPEEATQ